MKKEIWEENKQRYFELNPIESVRAKILWAVAAAVFAGAIFYLMR
jgi:hypothetical protein